LTAALGRRNQLCHYAISVCNQDRFTARNKADVFAQLILQNLQADGSHVNNGGFWKLPLSIRSREIQEMLISAARVDTDNGGEFMNETVAACS
jgi:hypothetical protein